MEYILEIYQKENMSGCNFSSKFQQKTTGIYNLPRKAQENTKIHKST